MGGHQPDIFLGVSMSDKLEITREEWQRLHELFDLGDVSYADLKAHVEKLRSKPKRREWWLWEDTWNGPELTVHLRPPKEKPDSQFRSIHVREVLPGDVTIPQELADKLKYYVGNPSAWVSYDDELSDLLREALGLSEGGE